MWNLVKTVQAVSEKKTFKDFTILYMYIAIPPTQTVQAVSEKKTFKDFTILYMYIAIPPTLPPCHPQILKVAKQLY